MKTIQQAIKYLEISGINTTIEIEGCGFFGFKAEVNDGEFITSAKTLKRLCDLVEDYWNCRGEEYNQEPEAWSGGFADNH